jgi:hypothetical protein
MGRWGAAPQETGGAPQLHLQTLDLELDWMLEEKSVNRPGHPAPAQGAWNLVAVEVEAGQNHL